MFLPLIAIPLMLQAQRPDSAVLLTRLGTDTLAVERVVRTASRVDADVVLRSPATTRTRYQLTLAPDGGMQELCAETVTPGGDAAAVRREHYRRDGDTIRVRITTGDRVQERAVPAPGPVLPFIDMVHWPLDLSFQRLTAGGQPGGDQGLLTGARVTPFPVRRTGPDSGTLTHPSRGTMHARISAAGVLLGLDAGATTRKLTVERRPWMEVDALVERWAAADRAGRGVGALSGRGRATGAIAGASLLVDYGTPVRRGREIWGALVPYGQVWRTGANEATHFTTDRALVLGSGADTLRVPAGTWTLFSIPEADGGVLIVNRQTGQTGTAYDAARDLGRVRMSVRALAEPVELFTIAVVPGGALELRWDRRAFVVPVTVPPAP
jgi:hypothetical protein